jgi:intergrase/recombinase
VQEGVVLLVNKARANRTLKDYTQELERLIHLKGEKPLFSEEERNFLDYLISNQRLVLFKQADEAAAGKVLALTG